MRAKTPADSTEEYYRRTVFIPFLDLLLAELDSIFSKHIQMVADGLMLTTEIVASKETSVTPEGVKLLAELYSQDLPGQDAVECKYHRWWKTTEGPLATTAQETLQHCSKQFYHNLHTFLQIMCTVPVTRRL